MKEIKYIELQDAQLLSITEPDEYEEVPTNEEFQNLKLGDTVRVSMFGERLCVLVQTFNDDHFICSVDELPYFVVQNEVQIGDYIRVYPKNIWQIF